MSTMWVDVGWENIGSSVNLLSLSVDESCMKIHENTSTPGERKHDNHDFWIVR